MNCETCKFWIKDDIGDDGQCRREPPRMQLIPSQSPLGQMSIKTISVVTRTNKDYWCGEYQLNKIQGLKGIVT